MQEYPQPTFEQVAARVAEDWENDKRTEMNDEYIASLLKRYDVIIEGDNSKEAEAAVTEVSQ